jgi:hypothetical protein
MNILTLYNVVPLAWWDVYHRGCLHMDDMIACCQVIHMFSLVRSSFVTPFYYKYYVGAEHHDNVCCDILIEINRCYYDNV